MEARDKPTKTPVPMGTLVLYPTKHGYELRPAVGILPVVTPAPVAKGGNRKKRRHRRDLG